MLKTERQSVRMSKVKSGGLDQYGAGPFEQQQFRTAGDEGVNMIKYRQLIELLTVVWHKEKQCM